MGRLPANTWARNREAADSGPRRWSLPGRVVGPSSWALPRRPRPGSGGGGRVAGVGGGRWSARVRAVLSGVSARRRPILVVLAAVLVVGAVVWAVVSVAGGDGDTSRQQEQAGVRGQSEAGVAGDGGGLRCPVIDSEGTLQGADEGDVNSSKGVIMAYEHAFFVDRDPAAMVAMTRPGPYVATESALAEGLKTVPEGSPWCVTIEPTATSGTYRVTIRHLPHGQEEVVTWEQDMTVSGDGPFFITSVRAR